MPRVLLGLAAGAAVLALHAAPANALTYLELKRASPYGFLITVEAITSAPSTLGAKQDLVCTLTGKVTRVGQPAADAHLKVGATVSTIHACQAHPLGGVRLPTLGSILHRAPSPPPVRRADGTIEHPPALAVGTTVECFGQKRKGTHATFECMK